MKEEQVKIGVTYWHGAQQYRVLSKHDGLAYICDDDGEKRYVPYSDLEKEV